MINMSRRRLGVGLKGATFDTDPVAGYLLKYQMGSKDLLDAEGTPEVTDGPSLPENKSILFSGTAEYLDKDADASKIVAKQAAFSVSFWIKVTAEQATDRFIFGFGTDTAGGTGFSVGIVANSTTVRFKSNNTTTDTAEIGLETWAHITITVSGTARKVYVDAGTPVSETKAVNVFTGATLKIGADSAGANTFTGNIDDVRFYGSMLDATQIQTLYDYNGPVDLTFDGSLLTMDAEKLTFDLLG
jgi:hypothetical protein